MMADKVTDRLENIKLTTEEEEVIVVSDEERKDEIESCGQSLIGKFLTCKPFNKRAAYNTIKKAWGLHDGPRLWKLVQIFSNSNFIQSLTWRGCSKGVHGHLITKP